MNMITTDVKRTMSSTQLAEMLGYEKKEINRKIKSMFGEKVDGGVIPPSIDSRGYVTDYNLPELESKMFVAKHDIKYLEKITQFWIDKKAPQLPGTYKEALEHLIEQVNVNEAQTRQIELDKPKVEFADAVAESKISIRLDTFAKATYGKFKIGRNKLYSLLRDRKVLRYNNEPYQKYMDAGWFQLAEKTYLNKKTEKQVPYFVTLVTGKGQVAIHKALSDNYPTGVSNA